MASTLAPPRPRATPRPLLRMQSGVATVDSPHQCELCNMSFNFESELHRHRFTKTHMSAYARSAFLNPLKRRRVDEEVHGEAEPAETNVEEPVTVAATAPTEEPYFKGPYPPELNAEFMKNIPSVAHQLNFPTPPAWTKVEPAYEPGFKDVGQVPAPIRDKVDTWTMKRFLAMAKNMTNEQTQCWIDFMRHEEFNKNDLPSSVHFTKKARNYHLQRLRPAEFRAKLKGTEDQTAVFSGVRPLDVLADALRRRGEHMLFAAGASARSKALWNSEGAKEIIELFAPVLTNYSCRPVLLAFWSDEWKQYDFRGVKLRALRMRVLNDTDVKATYLIGVYPEDVAVQEIYKELVVPDILKLERGIEVDGKNYIGTIHTIIGDHMELIDLAGLPGPQCKTYFSRHSLIRYEDFLRYLCDEDFREKVPLRESEPMYRLIAWLLYTAKHTANTAGCTEEYFINGILKEWGVLNVSPLWALIGFRRNFFRRLGVCWLHVELQGVFKHHLSAIVGADATQRKLTKEDITVINRRIRAALRDHPTLSNYYKDLLKLSRASWQSSARPKVMPAGGDILFSVQEVIIGCLLGKVQDEELLASLAKHIEASDIALKEELTELDLSVLHDLVIDWLLAYVAVEPLIHKPKLDSVLQFADYYRFLGPLLDYNTTIYEGSIKALKSVGRRNANNKPHQVCKTILHKIIENEAIDRLLSQPVAPRPSRTGLHTHSVGTRLRRPPPGLGVPAGADVREHTALLFNEQKLRRGAFLQASARPDELLQLQGVYSVVDAGVATSYITYRSWRRNASDSLEGSLRLPAFDCTEPEQLHAIRLSELALKNPLYVHTLPNYRDYTPGRNNYENHRRLNLWLRRPTRLAASVHG